MAFDGAPKTGYSATMPQLILASQSKIRKEALEKLGIPFTIQPAHVDESERKGEKPLEYIKRVAISKAEAIAKLNPASVILAADTPVLVGRRILQTPETPEEAITMLRLQSGRRINIVTVLVMIDAEGKMHTKTVASWLKFKRFSEEEIQDYVASNLWQHVSGALRFSHMEHWIDTFHGSFSGSRGLPLYETSLLLARAGLKVNPFT